MKNFFSFFIIAAITASVIPYRVCAKEQCIVSDNFNSWITESYTDGEKLLSDRKYVAAQISGIAKRTEDDDRVAMKLSGKNDITFSDRNADNVYYDINIKRISGTVEFGNISIDANGIISFCGAAVRQTADNEWHRITMQFQDGTAALYFDGEAVSSKQCDNFYQAELKTDGEILIDDLAIESYEGAFHKECMSAELDVKNADVVYRDEDAGDFLYELMQRNPRKNITILNADKKTSVKLNEKIPNGGYIKVVSEDGKTVKYHGIEKKNAIYEDFEKQKLGALGLGSVNTGNITWWLDKGKPSIYSCEDNGNGGKRIYSNLTGEYTGQSKYTDALMELQHLSADGKINFGLTLCEDSSKRGSFAIQLIGGIKPVVVSVSEGILTCLGNGKKSINNNEANIDISMDVRSGRIKVWVNGELTADQDNDMSGFTANDFSIRLTTFAEMNGNETVWFDDFYIFDNCSNSEDIAISENISGMYKRLAVNQANDTNSVNIYTEYDNRYSVDTGKTETTGGVKIIESDEPTTDAYRYIWDKNMQPLVKKSFYFADDKLRFSQITLDLKHPYIITTQEAFDKVKQEGNEKIKKKLIESANDIKKHITFSDVNSSYYIGYKLNSSDTLIDISRRVLNYTEKLGIAYKLTGNKEYTDVLWQMYNTVSNFENWGTQFLDIADMCTALSIGYDWCFDVWTDEQKQMIENAIYTQALTKAIDAYNKNDGWTKVDNNWNVVCNGSMLIGALAVGNKYPQISQEIIPEAISGIKYMLTKFGTDGTWEEGPGYMQYSLEYVAKTISTLESAYGSDFGLGDIDGLKNSIIFRLQASGRDYVYNFNDSEESKIYMSELMWLADKYGFGDIKNELMSEAENNGGVYDLIWSMQTTGENTITVPNNCYYKGIELVSMHGDNAWVAAQAGRNNVNHGHLDGGSFVYEYDGVRWASDLGKDDYGLSGYFSGGLNGKRWKYYRMRAEGHNTVVINPTEKEDQKVYAGGTVINYGFNGESPFAVMKLDEFYDDAYKVRRGIRLENGKRDLLIRDEITPKQQSDIYWVMQTFAECTADGNKVILKKDGKTAVLSFSSNKDFAISIGEAKSMVSGLKDIAQGTNNSVKITLKISSDSDVVINALLSGEQNLIDNMQINKLNSWN